MIQVLQPHTMSPYRGTIALTGAGLTDAVKQASLYNPNDTTLLPNHPLHITLLNPSETTMLRPLVPPPRSIPTDHVYIVSAVPQTSGPVRWLPVIWHHGNARRQSLGLPPKQFHITLSAAVSHELDKSVVACVRTIGIESVIRQATPAGLKALDHLALALQDDLRIETMLVAETMILLCSDSARGYIRWADAVARSEDGKLAMLAYAQAVHLDPSLLEYVVRRVRKYRTTPVFYGPTVTRAEQARISTSLQPLLLRR